MKIGRETLPHTAISTADEDRIVVRGADLCRDLIGSISFTDYFFLLLTGRRPSVAASKVLDATLVAIAEHGLVPSVQAGRMTLAAAPDAFQGAVAAGILGCGSVILGASEQAGRLLAEIHLACANGQTADAAIRDSVARRHAAGQTIPGYGHPLHKALDPRVRALFDVAEASGADLSYVALAGQMEGIIPSIVGKELRMNVSVAIPAVLLGIGFPVSALRGVPILARTAGLIAHMTEEMDQPIGFALSYQASRHVRYDGPVSEAAAVEKP